MSPVESHLEKLRMYYKPSRIHLLLVGESPPAHKGFFYDVASREGQLSRNTKRAFEELFEVEYTDRQEFLKHFKKRGCYLFDLFKQRGKTVRRATGQEQNVAIQELYRFLREERPKIVVSALKRISWLVEEAVKRAQLAAEYTALPYPTRHYTETYRSKLKKTLSDSGA